MRWLYPANIGTAIIDGQLTMVLVGSGAHMKVVTPEFVEARGLAAGSIQDLNNHTGRIPINGAGGKHTEPLGYVMIRVQIPYASFFCFFFFFGTVVSLAGISMGAGAAVASPATSFGLTFEVLGCVPSSSSFRVGTASFESLFLFFFFFFLGGLASLSSSGISWISSSSS